VTKIKKAIKTVFIIIMAILVILLLIAFFIGQKSTERRIQEKKESLKKVVEIKAFMEDKEELTEVIIDSPAGGYDSNHEYFIDGTYKLLEKLAYEDVDFIKNGLYKRISIILDKDMELTESDYINYFNIEDEDTITYLDTVFKTFQENPVEYKLQNFSENMKSFDFILRCDNKELKFRVKYRKIDQTDYLLMEVVKE